MSFHLQRRLAERLSYRKGQLKVTRSYWVWFQGMLFKLGWFLWGGEGRGGY